MHKRCVFVAAVFLACILPSAVQARQHLTYTTPSGIECVVTAEGLSSVRAGHRAFAAGGWRLMPAGPWAAGVRPEAICPPPLSVGPVKNRSLQVLDRRRARVRHVHGNVTVIYDYEFTGEDLIVWCRVENASEDKELRAVRFGGLRFDFGAEPAGVMARMTAPELQRLGLAGFHPSPAVPIGGSCAGVQGFGLGVCPLTATPRPSLVWWQPKEAPNAYELQYLVSDVTPPESSRTYRMLLRFSNRNNWQHLLTPWKGKLAADHGPVRYEQRSAPVAFHPVRTVPVEPAEGSATTLWNCVPGPWGKPKDPGNPYGYAPGEVRFDKPDVARAYAQRLVPALRQAGALGVIFKQVAGYDPKGLEHGASFGMMAAPEVAANCNDILSAALAEAGMLSGIAGSPDRYDVYMTIDRNEWLYASPDIPRHLSHMWSCRLRSSMQRLGVGMFLFTDFGSGADDVRIARYLRERTGETKKDVPCFSTQVSDLLLFYSAGCTEVKQVDGRWRTELGADTWEKLKWLVPGAVLYGRVRKSGPRAALAAAAHLYERGMGAIVDDADLMEMAEGLGRLHREQVRAGLFAAADAGAPLQVEAAGLWAREPTAEAGKEQTFTYRTPQGIQLTVTTDGLSRITLGDRNLAEGSWRTLSPGEPFGKNELQTKSLRRTDEHAVRVVHRHKNMNVVFDYAFEGQDVTVRARVENNHTSAAIPIVRFGALTFQFKGQPPKGQLSKHSKYGWLPDPGHKREMETMHPGWANRVGGSYGADAAYGVGATPLRTGFAATLLQWRGSWGSDKREFRYHVARALPPGGAGTYYLKLRLSTDRDWRHLLQPYRDHFRATYGTRRYEEDNRLVLQEMAATPGGPWVSEGNPLGYHSRRRLDRTDGAKKYAEEDAAATKAAAGKGPILWAQCGYQPRGMAFRSDFDVLPVPVEKNLPIYDRVMKEHGVQWGATVGRARDMNYRWKWDRDNILQLDPYQPAHVRSVTRRFEKLMKMGCTMFYLDAFGRRPDGILLMVQYRRVLPANILTYVEHPCDIVLPYSGARGGVVWRRKQNDFGIHWGLDGMWRISTWLVDSPGANFYAHIHPWPKKLEKIGEKVGQPIYKAVTAATKAELYDWMLSRKLGVMEARHKIGGNAKTYREAQHRFMTPDGRWREKPLPAPKKKEKEKKQKTLRREDLEDMMETEMFP